MGKAARGREGEGGQPRALAHAKQPRSHAAPHQRPEKQHSTAGSRAEREPREGVSGLSRGRGVARSARFERARGVDARALFPLPVWPYAKTVEVYPSSVASSRSGMPHWSKSSSCVVLRSWIESNANERARGPAPRCGQLWLSRSSVSRLPSSAHMMHSGWPSCCSGGRTRTATRTRWPPEVAEEEATEARDDGRELMLRSNHHHHGGREMRVLGPRTTREKRRQGVLAAPLKSLYPSPRPRSEPPPISPLPLRHTPRHGGLVLGPTDTQR